MENYVYSVCPPKQTCYRISTYGFQIEAFLRKNLVNMFYLGGILSVINLLQ